MHVTIKLSGIAEPITVSASLVGTPDMATRTMEKALAYYSPGASLEKFIVTKLGSEDIEGSQLSQVLSASVEALTDHILDLTLLHDNRSVPVEAFEGWLQLFGRMPKNTAEFEDAYQGMHDDLDNFANEDQVSKYNLDVSAPFYQAIDWSDAWTRMGYALSHREYYGQHGKYVFRLTP